MKFKIYYDNGNCFNGPPEQAQKHGVICILQERGDGCFHIISGKPYYIYVAGTWLGAYENDLVDYLMYCPGHIKTLIMGRLIPKHLFVEIYNKAKKDRDKEDLD